MRERFPRAKVIILSGKIKKSADLPATKPAITDTDRRDLHSEALPEG